MDFDSLLTEIEDKNEHFVGRNLNARKKERLDKMQECCRKITEAVPDIKTEWVPFSNRSRNAMVKIVIQAGGRYVQNQPTMALLGALFTLADDASIIPAPNGEDVIVCFGIQDMWDSFYYDNKK